MPKVSEYSIPAPSKGWEFHAEAWDETENYLVSRITFHSKEKGLQGSVPVVVKRSEYRVAKNMDLLATFLTEALRRGMEHANNRINSNYNLRPLDA